MAAIRTARERARDELTREIKAEARRQLAADGAQRLSLRAVARELGMVSSALYRYYPSRDELLTALIIDAYDALGEQVEQAVAAVPDPGGARARWLALCASARAWARSSPHEFALIYGTPVPGYVAPPETVGPAARVAMVLVALLVDAGPGAVGPGRRPPGGALAEQLAAVAEQIAPGLDPGLLARGIAALAQLIGLVSFELFGQLVGSAEPADHLFDYSAEVLADTLGLPDPR